MADSRGPMNPNRSRAFVLALLAVAALGCAGASFDGAVFRDHGVAFRVGAVPARWRRLDADGGALAFRDDAHGATMFVNGRCGDDAKDVPLRALTAHLLVGTTDRVVREEEELPFDGREALHTRLDAKLDGVRMAYDLFVLKKNGCVYDLVCVTRPEHAAAAVEAFRRFAIGFRALDGGRP